MTDTDIHDGGPAKNSSGNSFIRRISRPVSLVVVSALVALVAAWGLGGFNRPDISKEVHALLDDSRNDSSFLQLDLNNADIKATSEFVRIVGIEVSADFTKEDVMKEYNVDDFNKLPQAVRDRFSEGGTFRANVLRSAGLGVLVGDSVVFSRSILQVNVKPEMLSRLSMEVTLYPDPAVEDNWKREALFSGSLESFVKHPDVGVDFDHGLILINRPENKVIAHPNGSPYREARFEDVGMQNAVIYPRAVQGAFFTMRASVIGADSEKGLVYLQGDFSSQDIGTPVFVIRDGEPQWVGVLIGATASSGVVANVRILKDLAETTAS